MDDESAGGEAGAAPESANPFGYVDHSRFGGLGAELVYGKRPDGTYIHIGDSPRGLSCDCSCPACEKKLVAKKGKRQAHHFAHYGAESGCGRVAETNAHIWAKEVLEREKRIQLPAVIGIVGREYVKAHPGGMFDFMSARLEKRLGDIVPDVVLITTDGRELLVEVRVTHACGDEKIEKLRRDNLPTVEVDLSHLRKCADRELIEIALVQRAPREWLFNQKKEIAEAALRDSIEERERQKAEKLREQQESAKRDLQRKVDRLLSDADQIQPKRSTANDGEVDAALYAYEDVIGSPISASGFLVPPIEWQAVIVTRFLLPPNALLFEDGGIGVRSALTILADCIHPSFRAPPLDGLRRAVKAAQPQFRFPDEAIGEYLDFLLCQGLLQQRGLGAYMLSENIAEWLHERQRMQQEEDRRRRLVARSLELVLAHVPDGEQEGFSPGYWLEHNVPGYGLSPENLVVDGGEAWQRLSKSLIAIEKMIEGGEVVEQSLGLPLEAEIERARDRARLKIEQERAVRRTTLTTEASRLLGSDADRWLASSPDDNDVTLIEIALASTESLQRALDDLRVLHSTRQEQARCENEAAARRHDLTRATEAIYDAAHAHVFLRSRNNQLGASPWEYCVDRRTLAHCLALLPKRVEKHESARKW